MKKTKETNVTSVFITFLFLTCVVTFFLLKFSQEVSEF